MADDPAHILNLFRMPVRFYLQDGQKTIKIEDTGKGTKPVADDLEAVLRKIEAWRFDLRPPHQLPAYKRSMA